MGFGGWGVGCRGLLEVGAGGETSDALEGSHKVAAALEPHTLPDGLDGKPAILLLVIHAAAGLAHTILVEQRVERPPVSSANWSSEKSIAKISVAVSITRSTLSMT